MPDEEKNLPLPDDPDFGHDEPESSDGDDSELAERYGDS